MGFKLTLNYGLRCWGLPYNQPQPFRPFNRKDSHLRASFTNSGNFTPVEMPCSNVIRMPESVWTSTAVTASESVVTLFTSVQIACPWPIQPMIAIPPTAVQSGSHSPHNQLPTPVKLNKMLPFLNLYPGRQDANFLVNGFSFGFQLWHEGPRVSSTARNLVSAGKHPIVLQQNIDKELHLGRIAGPFCSPPFRHFRCSPIGLVPKQVPEEFRLTHNLSSPQGNSVNDHIDPTNTSVSYISFNDAVALVSRLGKGALLAKSEIKYSFVYFQFIPTRLICLDFLLTGICSMTNVCPWVVQFLL